MRPQTDNRPPEMGIQEFCYAHLDKTHYKKLFQTQSPPKDHEWNQKINLNYYSTAVPPSRGKLTQGNAHLNKSHVNFIMEPADFEQKVISARRNNPRLYRWVCVQQLSGKIFQITEEERSDLRAFVIFDRLMSFHQKDEIVAEIGDSGSVLIGWGRNLQHFDLTRAITAQAHKAGGHAYLMVNKNKSVIANVPTDLLRYLPPELRIFYTDPRLIGDKADWSTVIESPWDSDFIWERRTPCIYRMGDTEFATSSEFDQNLLAPFGELGQVTLKRCASAHLANYLTLSSESKVKGINNSLSSEQAQLLSMVSVDLPTGHKRSRGSALAACAPPAPPPIDVGPGDGHAEVPNSEDPCVVGEGGSRGNKGQRSKAGSEGGRRTGMQYKCSVCGTQVTGHPELMP